MTSKKQAVEYFENEIDRLSQEIESLSDTRTEYIEILNRLTEDEVEDISEVDDEQLIEDIQDILSQRQCRVVTLIRELQSKGYHQFDKEELKQFLNTYPNSFVEGKRYWWANAE